MSLIVTVFTNDIAFVCGESIQFMPTINIMLSIWIELHKNDTVLNITLSLKE